MFYYLSGELAFLDTNTCVIDCGGVGYKLTVSMITSETLATKLGQKIKLFTYLAVREDGVELFGFGSNEERECFNNLTSVSGIGPKVAMSILSTMRPDELALAICTENVKAIAKAPGLGPKSAARVILELLENLGGQAEETVLAEAVPEEEKRHAALRYLVRKKWVADKTDFLRRISDKTEKIATLACAPEEAMEYAGRCLRAPMQRSVLELMCGIGSVSVKELCYYTGATSATVKRLADLGYLELTDKPVLRCSQIKPAVLTGPLELSQAQEMVYSGIREQMTREKPGTALLHGVTGSGKTAVYLKLIRHCLETGKTALLLVPEIALTPQLLSLLAAHFGDKIAVQHSSLAATERYDQWKRIRRGEASVVVGTRSAVFAPCPNLGIIILDEEQEHSYKSENNPRYSAVEVALWRGAKEKTLVLLGSATPSVETMYRAKTGVFELYTLTSRYNGKALPRVQIVDMRQELREGNDLSLSRELTESIANTHAAGNQTILFLNRRGNSRSLICVNCGEAPECPRCSARLTYHSANNRMMCHYCGFSQPTPRRIPSMHPTPMRRSFRSLSRRRSRC